MVLEKNVIKNRIQKLLLILLFSSGSMIAQQKIQEGLTFIGKNNNNKLIDLNRFMSVSIDSIPDKCLSAEGLFKFKISVEGNVDTVEVSGNLPGKLIKSIKERILLTNNRWVFNDSLKKRGKSMVFFSPVYVSMNLEHGCNAVDPESYGWLFDFFEKRNIIQGPNNKHLISPGLYYGMR